MSRRAFTLIELLVVIAIIAVLAIVVILTLNPAQLLMQARDSNRLSDIASIQSALGVFQADQPGGSLGASNTVYPSLADSVATSTAGDQCQGLGLPTLPATYAYHCAATGTYRSNTNTGWIPVNFASISVGSPLSQLPVDPTNSSSSRLYYTYATNGNQFELTAAMESAKYKLGGSNDAVGNDGGTLATVYEKGSRLGLAPLDYGDSALVGYWTFDEGTGTVAYDYSGSNATGSWQGTLGTQYTASKVGGYAGNFNGSNNYVNVPATSSINIPTNISISEWISFASATTSDSIDRGCNGYTIYFAGGAARNAFIKQCVSGATGSGTYTLNTWYHVVATYDGSTFKIYLNGSLDGSGSLSTSFTSAAALTIGKGQDGFTNGQIDDVRIYNRALSAAEIQALYNAQK